LRALAVHHDNRCRIQRRDEPVAGQRTQRQTEAIARHISQRRLKAGAVVER
jgi:hypothetical protein